MRTFAQTEVTTPGTKKVLLIDPATGEMYSINAGLVAGAPKHEFEVQTATANQTSFTLAKTPVLGTTGKVRVSRNGVDITRAFTWAGAVGTYNPANNYGCTIDLDNILQFEYEAAV
jgi:hypothetical protein